MGARVYVDKVQSSSSVVPRHLGLSRASGLGNLRQRVLAKKNKPLQKGSYLLLRAYPWGLVGNEGIRALWIRFKELHRALIPSFPTKSQPAHGFLSCMLPVFR